MRRGAGACFSLALGALALAGNASAAPRDAIRDLPALTFEAEFARQDPAGRSADNPVRDEFLSTLSVDWLPPANKFGSGVQVKHEWHAQFRMKDNLNQTARLSSDTRLEEFRTLLELSKPQAFRTAYSVRRSDTWNSRGKGIPEPGWESLSERIFDLKLSLKGLPTFTAQSRVTDNYPASDGAQGNGSTVESSDYRLEYEKDAGKVYSRYSLWRKSTQTRNYRLSPVSDNATEVTECFGVRSMPLGQLGKLQLSAYLNESSSKLLGIAKADTTTSSSYQLDLSGPFAKLPANYSYNFTVDNQDLPGSNDARKVSRRLILDVYPPVPAGKSTSVRFEDLLTEWQDESVRTAESKQSLTWKCTLNPRTNGDLGYVRTSSLDLVTSSQTKSTETSTLNLSYSIPGERGSLGATFSQNSTTGATLLANSSDSTMAIRNRLNLGTRATAAFNLSQFHSDLSSGLMPTGSTDLLVSSFNYSLSSEDNYSLDLTWTNRLERLGPAGKRTSSDLLGVNVNWRPQPGWNYNLRLDSADSSELGTTLGGFETYRTNETIRINVSYTF